MALRDAITVEELRRLLRLDPETGKLYWLPRPAEMFKSESSCRSWNTQHAGREAMTAVCNGYRAGTVLGNVVAAHIVVFAIANGRWPVGQVDHKDFDKSNNRPNNLREATVQENRRNCRGHSDSTSKFCGVSWNKRLAKWHAVCDRDHLGYFESEVEAAIAYNAAASERHGAFARLNVVA